MSGLGGDNLAFLIPTWLAVFVRHHASKEPIMWAKPVTGALLGLATVLAASLATRAQEPSPPAAQPDVSKAVTRLADELKRHPIVADRVALFMLDVEKGEVTIVADEPDPGLAHLGSPKWSNDGTRILFDATPGTLWQFTRIESINLANERPTITDLGAGNCPTFSPDDKRIAFLLQPRAEPEAEAGVWVMQADGTQRRLFAPYARPIWSPDGKRLMMVTFSNPQNVSLLDIESGEKRPIRIDGYHFHTVPSWVSDGTVVAGIGAEIGDTIALLDVSNPLDCKVKEILWKKGNDLDVRAAYPVYSARTRRCVFVGYEPRGMALYSVQQGKSEPPKRLEPGRFDTITDLEYSPDGRYVLFCSDRPDRQRP
jgi:WD40 repeat protein